MGTPDSDYRRLSAWRPASLGITSTAFRRQRSCGRLAACLRPPCVKLAAAHTVDACTPPARCQGEHHGDASPVDCVAASLWLESGPTAAPSARRRADRRWALAGRGLGASVEHTLWQSRVKVSRLRRDWSQRGGEGPRPGVHSRAASRHDDAAACCKMMSAFPSLARCPACRQPALAASQQRPFPPIPSVIAHLTTIARRIPPSGSS